jgi:hypothetical protein
MKILFLKLLVGVLLLPLAALAADPDFNGRWRLDAERSSALDGWSAMDLSFEVEGSKVTIGHDMRWRSTRVIETNVVDTSKSVEISNYFRVDQRHMAVYAPKKSVTPVEASWLDEKSTLRLEASIPVEVSQGDATIRLYSEYRLGEGGETLTLIELHSTRNRPLIYTFRKLSAEDNTRP